MTSQAQTPSIENEGFGTLSLLRAQHSELLRRFHSSPTPAEMGDEITAFVQKGSRTGAVLDSEKDRTAAQNLIDYWTTVLIRMERPVTVPPLADFDIRLAPVLADDQCPYRGLEAFQEENSSYFYGRRNLVEELGGVLGRARLLCVLGPSGSGKSSLVRAGLIPRLRGGAVAGSQDWLILPIMVPGANPIANLIAAVGADTSSESVEDVSRRLLSDPGEILHHISRRFPARTILLVVDQFEEVFTLCTNAGLRQAFVKCLLEIVACPDPAHHLILTMRADFNANLASLPDLQPLVEKTRVNITPLTSAELRDAIELPAQTVGLRIDAEVVNELVIEVLGDPSALPLLQFTLLKLWENREHNLVTWQAYRRVGGGRQALAKTADDLYQSLTDEKKLTLKRVLLRMVRPGEGVEITSNRVQRKTLYQSGEDAERIDFVLEALIKSGLVRAAGGTGPESTVEVAHEALIRNWPTLAGWLETERVELRKRQRLSALAEQWNTARDAGLLLRGLPLQEARRYEDLSDLETLFVNASLDQESQEEFEREAQHSRELEAATRLAESEKIRAGEAARAASRLRSQAGYLYAGVVLLFLAGLLALLGWIANGQNAIRAETQARTAENNLGIAQRAQQEAVGYQNTAQAGLAVAQAAEKTAVSASSDALKQKLLAEEQQKLAEAQTLLARSRALASQALNSLRASPTLGQLLAVEAFHTGDTAESRSALLSSVQWGSSSSFENPVIFTSVDPPIQSDNGLLRSAAFSPDGTLLATGSESGKVEIWSVESHALSLVQQPLRISGKVLSVAFNPQGSELAFGGESQELWIWDYKTGRSVQPASPVQSWITRVLYNPDGTQLAVGTLRGWVLVYSVPQYELIRSFPSEAYFSVCALAWSPDSRFLISAGVGAGIHILDMAEGVEQRVLSGAHQDTVWGLAWSDKQNAIYSAGKDDRLVKWDLYTFSPQAIQAGQGGLDGLTMAPDEQYLATAGGKGTVAIWNAKTLEQITVREGHSNSVTEIAINKQGTMMAASSMDESVIFWKIDRQEVFSRPLRENGGPVTVLGADANGEIRVAGPGLNGFQPLGSAPRLESLSRDDRVYAGAILDGKKFLFAGNPDGSIVQLDGDTGQPLGAAIQTGALSIRALAVDPAGGLLAASQCTELNEDQSCAQAETQVYRIADHESVEKLFDPGRVVTSLAFALDGAWIALGDEDGLMTIHQVDAQYEQSLSFSYPSPVTSMAFSPDGQILASGHEDGALLLWDLTSGQPIGQPFQGAANELSALVFRPDGKTLVSGDLDGAIVEWDVDPNSWARRACEKAGRNMTEQEWDQFMKDEPFRNTCAVKP